MVLGIIEWWTGTQQGKGSLFVARAIETFERPMLKLSLQVRSPTFPPITRMEEMVLETWIMPDIQLSFANRTRSSVRSVGWILIGMDIGVNHPKLEGGSGESGSSTVEVANTARVDVGLLCEVTTS